MDFYCHAARLVVEVDGGIHESQAQSDAERESNLRALGLQILRFNNSRIRKDLSNVLRQIAETCKARAA